ncbi:MAG: DNA-directed RNA polymerase subunit D [Methanobacteriaceae archaeon]
MEIEVKEENGNEIIFIIRNVDSTFVNAIRRIAMTETPKIAVEDVNIIKNDSAMFDEVLAHRLGLVPLVSDNEAIDGLVLKEDCDCEEYCSKCSVSLLLNKSDSGVVYTKDLSSNDSKIKPVHDTIPLLKLKENQAVELEAIAQLGLGKVHAKWMPTTACAYKNYPEINFDKSCDLCKACVDACPRTILKVTPKGKKVKITNIEDCTMCKSCYRACPNTTESGDKVIDVSYVENEFIFKIETDGGMSAKEVLLNACNVLEEKANKFIRFCGGS